jgi:hypothetical protein
MKAMNISRKLSNLALVSAGTLLPTTIFAATSGAACDGAKAVGGDCTATGLSGSIQSIIDTTFYIIGAIAVLVIILGGIYYITSTGDAKRIQRAKDTILYAVIGLAVAILAKAIVGFVIGKLT